MVINQIINSERAPEPVGAYPHARRIGDFLFLSGVGPRERGQKKIPGVTLDEVGNITDYDIRVQTESVFRNIRYIIEDAGASWSDIVDVTVFLTNMNKDFPIVNTRTMPPQSQSLREPYGHLLRRHAVGVYF